MSYISPERQRIAKMNELGAKVDGFIAANGTQPPVYPAQFIHGQPRPIEIIGAPPPGHPAAQSFDNFTGLPDDGFGEQVTENAPPEPKVHPLAMFVDFDGTVKPPRWVIPGFIPAEGVTTIAGAPGVGKTTALLPLAMTAAGLHGDDQLLPVQWRHVVYITEDLDQAQRILAGIVSHSNLNISFELVRERLHIVKAVRLGPALVASVGKTYREKFTRKVQDVEVLPLVVIDTRSAVLAMENENDNSETSSMLAALKQGFSELPIWLVGHVSKANLGRSDVAELSNRGAGSNDGDGNQTMFLVKEGENRYLVLGKKRIEPRWLELEIVSYTAQTQAIDEFGNPETIVLRWGIAAPPAQSRKEAAEQTADKQRKEDAASLRQEIRDAVQVALVAGNPLNREGVKANVNRKREVVTSTIELLLSEGWLCEVAIPSTLRSHPKRSSFLVHLSTAEREEFQRSGKAPAEKIEIPPTWKKSSVPEPRLKKPSADAPGNANSNISSVPDSSVPLKEKTQGTDERGSQPPVSPFHSHELRNATERLGTKGTDEVSKASLSEKAPNPAPPAKTQPTNPEEDF